MCNSRETFEVVFDRWRGNSTVEECLKKVIKYVGDLEKENESLKRMNTALQEKILRINNTADDDRREENI